MYRERYGQIAENRILRRTRAARIVRCTNATLPAGRDAPWTQAQTIYPPSPMTAFAIAPRTGGTKALPVLRGTGTDSLRLAQTLRAEPDAPDRRYLQWLLVPDRGDAVALPVSRIDWIGAEDNYLRIHAGARTYLIRETMERLSGLLDPAAFLRIHRSTLVNLHRVKAFRRWGARDYLVILESGTELRMSRTYHRTLNSTVGDYR